MLLPITGFYKYTRFARVTQLPKEENDYRKQEDFMLVEEEHLHPLNLAYIHLR